MEIPRFLDVLVDPHDAIPDGCCQRWKTLSDARQVTRVRYEPDGHALGVYEVVAPTEDGHTEPAHAAVVEDSSAGTATLVYGGALGLRLRPVDGGETIAEAYLLLAHESVLD